MIGTKKIPKAQLQEGLIEMQQITSVTLFSTGWSLVSGLYEYTYTNGVILSTSIVDIVPENGSVSIVKTADILPATSSSTGSVKIYATNLPTANIIVTLNVYNNTSQSVSYSSDWIRPGDWLPMPTVGTQEFIGLLAITDDEANHIALLCRGAYTVDWGDGVVENFVDNVKANHSYTYSSISNSTISSRGYKQVIVRVTPQAGQNLTTVNLQQQNSILARTHTVGWLDISVNGSNITTLSLGGSTVRLGICERVNIGSIGVITSFASFFWQCHSLQSVSLFNTASGNNFSQMFKDCYMLKSIPLFVTSAGTNFSLMFSECRLLKTIPLLNTAIGTNFSSMFANCRSLQTIPLINTILGNNFTSMFAGCNSLSSIPLINTQAGLIFDSMFSGCISLNSIPLINTIAGTNFSSMFSECSSLQTIPLLNTAAGTTFYNMFISCTNLTTIPLLNTSAATTVQRMFLYCNSIQQVPNLNTALATNFSDIFTNCYSVAKGALQGTRYSINYANMCLSRNAVVDIFNGLGTAVGAQTITITTNPGFSAMPVNSLIPQYLWGLTVVPSTQDVYASSQNNYIYKQTGGVGPFVIDNNVASGWYRSMGVDIYDNVYCASGQFTSLLKKTAGSSSWVSISTTGASGNGTTVAGDFLGNLYYGTSAGLFKQTALTGSFVQVYTGNIDSLDISPFDGSVYIVSNNIIYKQTAATGSFNSVQTLSASYVVCMPNGDVYATNGTLYKQTAGTGSFVSMGILTNPGSNVARQIVDKSDGTLLTTQYGGDINYLDFNQVVTPTDRLIATNKGWTIA